MLAAHFVNAIRLACDIHLVFLTQPANRLNTLTTRTNYPKSIASGMQRPRSETRKSFTKEQKNAVQYLRRRRDVLDRRRDPNPFSFSGLHALHGGVVTIEPTSNGKCYPLGRYRARSLRQALSMGGTTATSMGGTTATMCNKDQPAPSDFLQYPCLSTASATSRFESGQHPMATLWR
jgi:hypothetical protein